MDNTNENDNLFRIMKEILQVKTILPNEDDITR
jgi:hypothetical protein